MPGLDIQVAARLVRDWRKGHRHGDGKAEDQRKPMGYNTQSVATDDNTEAAYEAVYGDDDD